MIAPLLDKPEATTTTTVGGSDPLINSFVEHVEDVVSFAPDIENVVEAVATITLKYADGVVTHSQTVFQHVGTEDCVITKSIKMEPKSDDLFTQLTKDRLDLSEIDTVNNTYSLPSGNSIITLLYDTPNV